MNLQFHVSSLEREGFFFLPPEMRDAVGTIPVPSQQLLVLPSGTLRVSWHPMRANRSRSAQLMGMLCKGV